ncbi:MULTISPECIES: hypothetical protein [unclassified Streptomyces]|uniref:hypothetical protein n=1 Tax=unclassified Streptomyces TaxID=2593676 RepID=UPI0029A63914|nr:MULTISPECIES: hypothetical protein [unclassified Streptomyces]MDX3772074.1 hypothetical protein [Streptomyces sp. AK08-01B]MDX3821599.1 hypothetical protein [Streptomyces sp. AK08-01A]
MSEVPVIVYPPSASGGRYVRAHGLIVGVAYSLRDVTEVLRLAHVDDMEDEDVEVSLMIEWRGGGPEVWSAP